ncbi:hypothetical protein Tco_1003083 [Tanacetum coccineum]|uniref:Uncharacterized protein n=1 Tax=Tanacetum coccineum TaxID=301880 RepID=A0ABQ5F9E9_9ASTR
MPGHAVIEAAQLKRVKYEAKCADIKYGFIPFSFSSLGELEKDAVTLLKRIQKFSLTQYIGARTVVHIFSRISFAIARGVGAQIVSRLLTISSWSLQGIFMEAMLYRMPALLVLNIDIMLFTIPSSTSVFGW